MVFALSQAVPAGHVSPAAQLTGTVVELPPELVPPPELALPPKTKQTDVLLNYVASFPRGSCPKSSKKDANHVSFV